VSSAGSFAVAGERLMATPDPQSADLIRAVRARLKHDRAEQSKVIEPSAATPCKTCPWRLENHSRPPLDHPKATFKEYYEPVRRPILPISLD
jgi:hypothetical protein